MSPLPASGTAAADVKAESTLARVLGAGMSPYQARIGSTIVEHHQWLTER